jgi:subtilisin family serine protease
MSSGRQRRKIRSKMLSRAVRSLSHGAERLEPRHLMAGLAGDDLGDGITSVNWNGDQFLAIRDSYVLQMPQTNAATSAGLWDYASDVPTAPSGWTVRSLGMGFFSLETLGESSSEVMAWSADVGVTTISPNTAMEKQAPLPRKLPNDPRFVAGQQWGLDNPGPRLGSPAQAKADADIDAPEAWRIDLVNQNTGSRDIVVAIMDDGIDHTHPDLQLNMWQRPQTVPQLLPGGGYVGRFGFDVANGDTDNESRKYYSTMPNPNDVHGTAVAGIIGAKGYNNRGMTGVNWDVSLMSVNIFEDVPGGEKGVDRARFSTNAHFVEAVNRVITLKQQYGVNIAVVNASWMSISEERNRFSPMAEAVARLNQAGILFVTAAGNGYESLQDFVGDLNDPHLHRCYPAYPANYYYADPVRWGNVISVAASTASDTLARFSNFGTSTVHIAAPGEEIWTTVPLLAKELPGDDYPSRESIDYKVYGFDPLLPFQQFDPWSQTPQGVNGGYARLSGTSLSTAYVSGVAALAAAEYKRWTGVLPSATYLRKAIIDQADQVPTLRYKETTTPALNIAGKVVVDPMDHPEHAIQLDRRLNAYNTVKWVRDNLPPKVTFENVSVREGDSGLTDVVDIRVTVSRPAAAAVTVDYWTEDYPNEAVAGVNYVAIPKSAPRQLTIPAGVTTARVTLPAIVIGNTTQTKDLRFWVKLRMGANAEAWLGSRALAVTIKNDDSSPSLPAATLDPAELVVAEGGGRAGQHTFVQVPVTLDFRPIKVVSVPYLITTVDAVTAEVRPRPALPAGSASATPSRDFVALSGALRFAPGQQTAFIPVRIIKDGLPAGAAGEAMRETFAVQIRTPNLGVLRGGREVKLITIVQETPPPAEPAPLAIEQPEEKAWVAGQVASVVVQLSGTVPAGHAVTINYRTVPVGTAKVGQDYQPVPTGRLTIPAGKSSGTFFVRTFKNPKGVYPSNILAEITGATLARVTGPYPRNSLQLDRSQLQLIEISLNGVV